MIPYLIHTSLLSADKNIRASFFTMRARLLILTLLVVLLGSSCQRKAVQSGTVENPPVQSALADQARPASGRRPVHPYSVVSGGLSTPQEMATAVKNDTVVREHYAGLVPASFKVEKLQEDRQGYVSYRIRDKVFWTTRMMTLKKGEVVLTDRALTDGALTDGATMLRGRCGNRVSSIPMEPVAAKGDEPEEVVFDSFQDERLLAGIPPVPEASPIGGALVLTRYPEVSGADSLLISPGSLYGLFLEPAGVGGSSPRYIPFGGGGGFAGGGGGNGSLPPSAGLGPLNPAGPFPPALLNPALITYVPPALTPGLPPPGPYGPPQPYVPPTPNVTVPPTSGPPPSRPPISILPPSGSIPPITPPNQPPGAPPTVPPSFETPPTFSPPPVLDPPPPPDSSIPEPSTFLMVASALAAYGVSRYFAKKQPNRARSGC